MFCMLFQLYAFQIEEKVVISSNIYLPLYNCKKKLPAITVNKECCLPIKPSATAGTP